MLATTTTTTTTTSNNDDDDDDDINYQYINIFIFPLIKMYMYS